MKFGDWKYVFSCDRLYSITLLYCQRIHHTILEYLPIEEFEGHVIAIIHRTNDDDDKLVVAPKSVDYSDDAIRAMTEFQERFFESIIIR